MIDEPIVGGFGISRLRLSDWELVRSNELFRNVSGSLKR